MAAKTPFEVVQELAQNVISLAPVIVLGSGASAAHGVPGMWKLGDHLRTVPASTAWGNEENNEWKAFCDAIDKGVDLEAALGRARLSELQTNTVVQSTRDFLLPSDLKAFNAVLANRQLFPLSRLYQRLFTSTHRTIEVVTTNYDRIGEYAADAAGYMHFTGFEYGHLQHRAKDPTLRLVNGSQQTRTVCVWKVHGSLDWFRDDQNQIIGARACLDTPPGFTPVMVTPGIDKYRITHGEPFRTIFTCADGALENARAYLCIGYGFNDEHVQPKLIERCELSSTPLLIITKELTPTTKQFLGRGRCKRYLALEECPSGTRAFYNEEPAGIELPGQPVWQFGAFLEHLIGVTA